MAESIKGGNRMNQELRKDTEAIARGAIAAVSPEAAVRRVLTGKRFSGKLYLVCVGKAAWWQFPVWNNLSKKVLL